MEKLFPLWALIIWSRAIARTLNHGGLTPALKSTNSTFKKVISYIWKSNECKMSNMMCYLQAEVTAWHWNKASVKFEFLLFSLKHEKITFWWRHHLRDSMLTLLGWVLNLWQHCSPNWCHDGPFKLWALLQDFGRSPLLHLWALLASHPPGALLISSYIDLSEKLIMNAHFMP